MVIPKNIHFIWLQGWNQLPDKFKPNVEDTARLNSDWRIYGWDDNSIRQLLNSLGKEYLDKYDGFKILHQKIDFARYAILYAHGGISVDADAKAVKSFNEIPYLNERNFIVGYSPLDKMGALMHGYDKRPINNSVIITQPQHPILKEVLDYILTLECKPEQTDFSCVIFTTGESFNKILYKHKEQITILDNSYFEGCHVNDVYCELKPNAIIEHKHEQSWIPRNYLPLAKFYYWVKRFWKEILLAVALLFTLIFIFRNSRTTQT